MTDIKSDGSSQTMAPEPFSEMHDFALTDAKQYALSLRLVFAKFSRGFTPADFDGFIDEHVGKANVTALGRLSFPNEWHMQVTDPEVRERVLRLGRVHVGGRCCWLSPLHPCEVRGFIHWLPNAVSHDTLSNFLAKYGEVLFIETQKHTTWNPKVDSEVRYFGMLVKNGQTKDDIPHFFRVNNHLGLIIVRGRNPACFFCKEVGHRKSECKKYRERLHAFTQRKKREGPPRTKPRGRRHKPTDGKITAVPSGEGKAQETAKRKKQQDKSAKQVQFAAEKAAEAKPMPEDMEQVKALLKKSMESILADVTQKLELTVLAKDAPVATAAEPLALVADGDAAASEQTKKKRKRSGNKKKKKKNSASAAAES